MTALQELWPNDMFLHSPRAEDQAHFSYSSNPQQSSLEAEKLTAAAYHTPAELYHTTDRRGVTILYSRKLRGKMKTSLAASLIQFNFRRLCSYQQRTEQNNESAYSNSLAQFWKHVTTIAAWKDRFCTYWNYC